MSKNRALYLPYLLMSILMIGVDYIMCYLSVPSVIIAMDAGQTTRIVMVLGRAVIDIFSAIFLYYCNTFLIGRRMKEFGLYNVLGMGKRNIACIMLWETLLTAGIALLCGLLLGVSLARAAELLMIRLLQAEIATTITVNWVNMLRVAEVFGCIYAVILLVNLIKLRIAKPMELLRSESAGERPPKANWLVALLGTVLLGIGYFIAVTVKSPTTALLLFFVAVLLVIAGTYLLFISGSVALCRLLQKSKRYYYRANHFISLSSMAFRMKRNGGGLATICILCTMVLVILSSTLCLYTGLEEMIRISYPRDLNGCLMFEGSDPLATADQDALFHQIIANFEADGYKTENAVGLSALKSCGKITGQSIHREQPWNGDMDVEETVFLFYPLSAYEALTEEDVILSSGEMLSYTLRGSEHSDALSFYGSEPYTLRWVKNIPDVFITPIYRDTSDCMIFFVEDFDAFAADLRARSDTVFSSLYLYLDVPAYADNLGMPISDDKPVTVEGEFARIFGSTVKPYADHQYFHLIIQARTSRQELYSLFGSLFFLGLVLGSVFSLTAVLIIYYKQISEGYEDAGRFATMRKVGLDDRQIHRSINSQVLTVFFAPLMMTGLHGLFAMPMVLLVLRDFGMNNASLFYGVSGICFLIFALLYTAVYFVTSRTYYRIVR